MGRVTQLPGYLCIGDKTLCHFNLLWLDLVETKQMLGSCWKYLGGYGVVLQEALVYGFIFYHNGLALDTNLRCLFQLGPNDFNLRIGFHFCHFARGAEGEKVQIVIIDVLDGYRPDTRCVVGTDGRQIAKLGLLDVFDHLIMCHLESPLSGMPHKTPAAL